MPISDGRSYDIIIANTEDEFNLVRQLRHKVYCEENDYESQDPNKLFRNDEWDLVSEHILCSINGVPTASARYIPPWAAPFPAEVFGNITTYIPYEKWAKTFEVSRIIVSRGTGLSLAAAQMAFKLVIKKAWQIGKKMGCCNVTGAVDRRFHVMLRRVGLPFKLIGPYSEYHGLRAPVFLEEDWLRDKEIYKFLNDGVENGCSA